MTNYNVLERQTETKVRQAQVIYLHEVLKKCFDEIAEITGYAIATVKSYIKKFADLLDYAKSIFGKIKNKRRSKYDNAINENGYDIDIDNKELCYLFEFYDSNNNLVCSKVGTTTRTVRTRLREELKAYSKMGVTSAKVNRIYDCGEYPAEGLESLIRSKYIKLYPKAFKKNDRFFDKYFDLAECDEMVKNYLA